jgi:hypothetical protein
MEKETTKKELDFQSSGMPSSYSVFKSFYPLHFIRITAVSGIWLRVILLLLKWLLLKKKVEVVDTLVAQERVDAMLTEARIRKEKEILAAKEKEKQVAIIERGKGESLDEDLHGF